jgi:NAD dependent epimerase/dehydratase
MTQASGKGPPQTALVTGAGGFIGSHLVELLIRDGWHVKALVHYNGRSRCGWLDEMSLQRLPGLEIIAGDVTDPFQMAAAVAGCAVVFHLAALIGIPYSYMAPASYVQTNMVGTLNLLEASRQAKVSRFVHTSTSETYGTAQYTPMDEQHPLQAQSPYAASKIGADKLVESYVKSFDLPAIIVRPFNTYGPRQSARAIIPTIITQALQGNTVRLGSLTPVRDLTYAPDTAAGFLAAAGAPAEFNGRVINLGTGVAVSIGKLAELIFGILGGDYQVITEATRLRPSSSEVMELISNNQQARQNLGWQPCVPLEEGLRQTIQWLRHHRVECHTDRYTV